MKALPASLAALLLIASHASADQIDRYVEARLKRDHVPGTSIAVLREGKVIKARGYGLADVELNVPATEHTVYQWASVTKQFTAGAAMLLIRDGKLKLDDPVRLYYTNAPASWSNVTVRHLIHHTSGIKSYTGLKNFFKTVRKDYTPDELIALVRDEPMEFAPGEKWSYNNTGYFLLGLVIENASGKSYAEFLRERIFQPLCMDAARVTHQFEIIPNRATGYEARSNKVFRAEFVSPSQPYAAGALMGTVLDLAKWDAALYTDTLFSASEREELWKPVKLNNGRDHPYGYGWFIDEVRGHRCVSHSGGIHGFGTHIARFVEDKLTVIVLMNGTSGDPRSLANGIAGHYLPGLTLSSIKPPKRDPDPELTQKLKQALFDLADRKPSDLITTEFLDNYKSGNRAETLKKRLANLKSFTFVTSDEPPKDRDGRFGVPVKRLRSYKLVTPEETRFYTFELTEDNKVAWYQSSAD